LELVLFRAIPRRDVKPLARQLLEHFGDFNRVLSAPLEHLESVPRVSDAECNCKRCGNQAGPRKKARNAASS
jgi:DNA repair protein RadC